ncbi:polysaccharide deacetylase family protein [Amycolatopsis sp. K13G38]|uniref:Polysaccharide deacetylase family protein n=1 Tax=Amycolatopsis acididurans TaxID=2724524 RepID=A0ABX1JCA6_9PSEU|nr:polysaccharide deacetylase family protein [Amycolatopsis acididurans]NKQ56056.1 polysaccharide deacetylase family protein [Amycolatopsis acididurans]
MRSPLVFMYHSVDRCAHDPYRITVDPQRLDLQLGWLRRHGLRGVSVGELRRASRSGDARGLVGLTFDDGYADFLSNALPVLERHDFTATVFVIAGRLGGTNDWDPEGPRKKLLTGKEIRQVAAAGIEIGCHGWSHVSLPRAGGGELGREVAGARLALRELTGQDVAGFCYPYGDVDARAVGAVRDAGYAYGCAIWRSPFTGALALPRIYIGESDAALRLWAKTRGNAVASRRRAPRRAETVR